MKINAKPIDFKFNDYLSKGYELLKNNFGNILLAGLFCMIMSIIPFCGLLGAGNFYKYCRKISKGEAASPSDIFNFDDFMPYFIYMLIIFAAILVIYIPFIIVIPFANHDGGSSSGLPFFVFPYMIVVYIVIVVFALKAFYIPALISLGGVKDIKTAWNMSKIMTKNNLLSIFLFSLVVGFLSQLGVILCGIGLLITIPYLYTTNYFAFEDAMKQIEHDEIMEIGQKDVY